MATYREYDLTMQRKPGRPRALTLDVIAQAALDDGVDTFSMPSVARRLGVAHSGLYRYVTDRDDLMVEALTRAYTASTWPDADLPWEELLRAIGDTIWRACYAFPGLDRATQHACVMPPVLIRRMEDYAGSLQAQRFLAEDAAVAIEFAISLALDCSSQAYRRDQLAEASADLPASPTLTIDDDDVDEVWHGCELYTRKLDIVVAGLATRRI